MSAIDARDLATMDQRQAQARENPRATLGRAAEQAAWHLARMVDGREPADPGRIAACRAVLELGEHHARR